MGFVLSGVKQTLNYQPALQLRYQKREGEFPGFGLSKELQPAAPPAAAPPGGAVARGRFGLQPRRRSGLWKGLFW